MLISYNSNYYIVNILLDLVYGFTNARKHIKIYLMWGTRSINKKYNNKTIEALILNIQIMLSLLSNKFPVASV